ncbi:esterase/lipase family protein [Actinomadura xylanilytica]|uniref:esterase/lipase family protein n=1 Tax=Actinomadura xylanilytica TaxID=887459 RepID=UPI00255A9DF6|nr:hypothetical protein [Actinomadura xylanilytica]MDL4773127.1 hypothetical protein [Actinomadura xylanilytica]
MRARATFVNMGADWAVLSPMLANAGYRVFAFNYGMAPFSADRIGGMADIPASAQVMSAFVDQVLASTGAAKVRRFVALAPGNILIQDQCPQDFVGHVGMFNDGPVLQNVLNALGPDEPGFLVVCAGFGLPV